MNNTISIRTATLEDAAHTLAIYTPYVTDTDITFDTEIPSLDEWIGRIRNTLARHPYLIAFVEGRAAGYAYASPFRHKAAYDWSVETTIYLSSEHRAQGIGRQLHDALEQILSAQGVTNLNACITYPNPASIAFHQRMGYAQNAYFTRCGYKLDRWLDVVWMEKHIAPHTVPPPVFIPYAQLPPAARL